MIFASRDIPGQFSRFDFPQWLPAPLCASSYSLCTELHMAFRHYLALYVVVFLS